MDPSPTGVSMDRTGDPGKPGSPSNVPVDPQYSGQAEQEGIAGFHPDPFAEERMEGSGGPATPAGIRLDPDTEGRVNTVTGHQPGNAGGSRTRTPPEPVDTSAPQPPDNTGSTDADLDNERKGGLSGGLAGSNEPER